MKNLILLLLLFCTTILSINAQTMEGRPSLAVLQIDSKGLDIDPVQMGDIARIELDKLGKYQIYDKYDVQYLADQNQINIENCFGRLCAIEIGKALQADKIMIGSVENFGDLIVITLRIVDVDSGKIDRSKVLEFIDNTQQIQTMIRSTLLKMFELPVEEDVFKKLTNPHDYENVINTPKTNRLNLSGPRMGMIYYTGELGKRFQADAAQGGYDALPVMFQFGYQFETTYINEGNFQALFEFIPMITGLDQGLFIPSFTLLNGLRSSKDGLEFHFGPVLSMARKAEGYYDEMGNWQRKNRNEDVENTFENLDSRGDFKLNSGFLFGVGKTFRSGRMNIPVNVYFVPGRSQSHRFGISVGFNAKNK